MRCLSSRPTAIGPMLCRCCVGCERAERKLFHRGMGVIGAVIIRRTFLGNDPRGDLLFKFMAYITLPSEYMVCYVRIILPSPLANLRKRNNVALSEPGLLMQP